MEIKRRQITALFEHPEEMLTGMGIWSTGTQGEGEYTSWYKNGHVLVHAFYRGGQLHGEYKRWHRDGTLVNHRLFDTGKKVENYLNEF